MGFDDHTEMHALCYMSATDALAAFESQQLRPSTLLKALLWRIEQVNPVINALTDRFFDQAMQEAEVADRLYAQGRAHGQLLGLPILVKDAQRVLGQRTTHGSLLFMDATPEAQSDPMIERMQEAGAIVLARTTVPEFCVSGVCRSRAWGDSLNPFNTEYGPGGSSGGSAAALAAGFAPIATGTDIGGSIRIPASCCGVVGFKPPHGRNPDGPPANFDRYNHCGPLARSIADLALIQSVVAGAHPRDHDSLRQQVTLPRDAHSIKGMKIAYSMDMGYRKVDQEVRRNTRAALAIFEKLGAEIREVHMPWDESCDTAAMHWYNTMHYLRQTAKAAETDADNLCDYTLAAAKGVGMTTLDDVSRSWEVQHEMYQYFGALMEKHDLFICPTTTIPAVAADHDVVSQGFKVDGEVVDPEYGWVLTHHFNMLHNCPVMAVPSGVAHSGVPTGIQLVGRSFDDPEVFRAALAYEQAVGGWFRDPKARPFSDQGR